MRCLKTIAAGSLVQTVRVSEEDYIYIYIYIIYIMVVLLLIEDRPAWFVFLSDCPLYITGSLKLCLNNWNSLNPYV